MATKPTKLPAWNTGGANNTEPSGAEKIAGWTVGQQPPSSYFNWLQKLYYEWAAYLDDLEAQAMNWTAEHIFDEKITVSTTNATSNAVTATGGSTAGHGVSGTAQVGSTGTGVVGLALGSGHGVSGAAVNAAANGGNFVNNANSATALKGTSTGTSSYGVWGEGKRAGVKGLGTSGGNGGTFTGDSGAAGIEATGGATNGIGGIFTGRTAAGVYATRDDSTTLPVITADGSIDFNGATYTSAGTGFTNKLTVENLIKAWGVFYSDAPSVGPTLLESFNCSATSITNPGGICRIDFQDDMADTNYAVIATVMYHSTIRDHYFRMHSRTTGYFEFTLNALDTPFTAATYAELVPGTDNGVTVSFMVIGEQ